MARRKGIPVSELVDRLANDSEYQNKERVASEQRTARATEVRAASASLLRDLASAGLIVDPDTDAFNIVASPEALRVLARHLRTERNEDVLLMISHALARPEAAFAWKDVVRKYRETQGAAKDGLAFALDAMADNSRASDLLELARDEANGQSRAAFFPAMARSRLPEVMEFLETSREDRVLGREATRQLEHPGASHIER